MSAHPGPRTTFELRVGTQHQRPGALIGLLSVGVRDGALVANVAVGTPRGRTRRVLTIGESMQIPGHGPLTLVDVQLGGPSGGAVQLGCD